MCVVILLNISMLTRAGDNWSQFSGLRCLFSLVFNFSGVSFLPQTSLIALVRLGLILGSQSYYYWILLSAPTGCHQCDPLTVALYHWPNITFLRGLSSSCCNSSSTSEGAKRLRESSPWEIFLFLFGLPGNFAGLTFLFPLGSLEGVSVSSLSLLRSSGCPLVWVLYSLPIFSTIDLESLLTEFPRQSPSYLRNLSAPLLAL